MLSILEVFWRILACPSTWEYAKVKQFGKVWPGGIIMANSGNRAYLHWHTLYEAALLESDLDKLPQRITDAQYAVMNRIIVLDGRDCGGSESEVLMNALNVLRDLEKMVESVQVARNSGDAPSTT
jgi:hypothetical protein